jgi:hypothetical protein
MSSRSSRLTWASLAGREISIANRPKTLRDATAGWWLVEQLGSILDFKPAW